MKSHSGNRVLIAFILSSWSDWRQVHGQYFKYLSRSDFPLQELLACKYIRQNRHDESVFLSQLDVTQWPRFDAAPAVRVPSLSYTLTLIKVPALYDWCKESVLNKRTDKVGLDYSILIDHYEKINATPWLAEEAYQGV